MVSRSYSNAEEDKDEMTALSSTTIPPLSCPSSLHQIAGYGVEWTDEAHDNVEESDRATVESVHPLPRAKGRDEGVVENKRSRARRV